MPTTTIEHLAARRRPYQYGAAHFDGTAFQQTKNTDVAFHYSGDFTIATWVKIDAGWAGTGKVMGRGTFGSEHYLLYIPDGVTPSFQMMDTGANTATCQGAALSQAAWHLLVATFVSATGVLKLYVDNAAPVTGMLAGTPNWNTGIQFNYGGDDTSNVNLKGALDMGGAWSRALSAGDVASLWNGSAGRTYGDLGSGLKVNLTAYWDCDDTDGLHLTDTSGNGHTLTGPYMPVTGLR